MKILFINPSLRPGAKRRQLPVGLAYILTATQRAGFDFDLVDMDINDLSMPDLELILSRNPADVYALGCIVTGFRLVRQISALAKKINPNSVVVAGNSVATSIPEILLRYTDVDVCVMGEGDITFVELLKAIKNGESFDRLPGIVFKENGSITYNQKRPIVPQIDVLGFPDWNLFELDKYNQFGKVNANTFSNEEVLSYPLNAARGCPFHCNFCYHVFKGQRYRKYSEEAVIDEIKRLHHEYGANFISFWDELTFPSIQAVESMVEHLQKLDFKLAWEATSRGDLFKKEHLGLIRDMAAVGCESLSFSLENASPEILAAMNKKLTVSQFVEQSQVLWEGGVTPLTSIIFGYPQETPETIMQTLKVCEICNLFPSTGFLLPLPGTPIYEWAKENGHIADEIEYLERIGDRQDLHINLTKMTDAELLQVVETNLRTLAKKQGLKLDSVFKTVTYQKPKIS
jgi:radical SAM superfamily enzyme YgiQ (UPF0313 family)